MGDPVTTMIIVDVALAAASMAMTASQKFQGPRLSDTNVSLADYGTPIPRFWGIRRFETQIIWAEKLREKKTTQKTKGGKYTNYRYYGTWAVVIADHAIDSVSRVWLDKHLAYDVTGTGPISLASAVAQLTGDDSGDIKLARGTNFRVYDGTQTTPDPRIESWCEDRYGANTAPAYKDVSYVVFQDIPLEKFGNRIPQISVEAINNKTDVYPSDTRTTDEWSGFEHLTWAPDYNKFLIHGSPTDEIWDTASRARIISETLPVAGLYPRCAVDVSGGIWGVSGTSLYHFASDGLLIGASYPAPGGTSPSFTHALPITNLDGTTGTRIIVEDIASGVFCVFGETGLSAVTVSFRARSFFPDGDGNLWAAGGDLAGNVGFYCFEGTREGDSFLVASPSGAHTDATAAHDGEKFIVDHGGYYFVDDVTGAVSGYTTVTPTGSLSSWFIPLRNVRPGHTSFWAGTSEISTADLSVIRTLSTASWTAAAGGFTIVAYDPINHAFIGLLPGGTSVAWLYIDRVGSNGVTLQTVVDDVSTWCGLSGQDTAALTQTVPGYSVTQGSGKDMIAPLLDIHDVDPRPHDFAIQFVNRGSSAAGTISTSELAREGNESRYVASITQDTDLPRKITFNFADKNFDQQANNVIAQRPLDAVDATREQTIDLGTYVADSATAQKFADRYLRRQWIGRDKFTLSLTAQRLALEPADVYNLELDGITTSARLTKVTLAGGKLNTEWDRDFPSVTTLGTGTGSPMDGRDPEVIYIPGPTKGFVIDSPLAMDSHSDTNPLLYFAAGPYTSIQNWPGAFFMQADAGGTDYDVEWNTVDSASGATWGYATDALSDVASPWVWDRGNTVNVKGYLTLTSCTEADINADPTLNLAHLGDELLNFTTATLEADGSYTLSGFKRGRRGTEWATNDHASGDEFVLVSNLQVELMGLSDVGTDLSFKAQTLARPIAAASPIDVTFAGRSLMPYAPSRVKWTTDGTDLFGEIIRRTRVGGSWVGGSTIPLSENSETYEVDVYHSTTLKRTISVSGTNTFTYTAAQMSADSNSVSSPPPINAYQLSDAVGRGFALAA